MSHETIWYFAHPVAGDAKANAARALRWFAWIRKKEPTAVIIAPWLASLLAGDVDDEPTHRPRAMRESRLIAAVADGIILAGGRVSSGMQDELDVCASNGGHVCDLSFLGPEPPTDEELAELYARAKAFDPQVPPATVLELGCRYWEAP